jgi:hypothetical protein
MRTEQVSVAFGRRVVALLAIPLTVAAGLLARRWLAGLPAKLAGDALYTALVYAIALAFAPDLRPRRAAAIALGWSFAVELFQLTGVPAWLSAKHILLRLIFGTTFGFVDLAGYVIGAIGALSLHAIRRAIRRRASPIQ